MIDNTGFVECKWWKECIIASGAMDAVDSESDRTVNSWLLTEAVLRQVSEIDVNNVIFNVSMDTNVLS